ncbi:hypothetical protein NL676_015832 [Syzygium grande]|nr:hypothetical protein NL676_015832 [Syzygium grande]
MGCAGTDVEVVEVEELELSSSRAVEEAANGVGERDGADAELGSTIVDVEGNSELSVGGRGSKYHICRRRSRAQCWRRWISK